jgi:choline kinase
MKVRIGPDGYITAFGKGIPVRDAAGESIGIERVSAEASVLLFEALAEAERAGETDLYYEDVYSRLIERGLITSMVEMAGNRWCEVDGVEDLARAARLFP